MTKISIDWGNPLVKSLLLAFLAALSTSAFVTLGSEALEGETLAFDNYLLQCAKTFRTSHPSAVGVMRDFSGLGGTAVLAFFTCACVGYLLLINERVKAVLVTAAILTGTALVSIFKATFGRHRPDVAFADFMVDGLSFPSGHASMSAIVFLTLGALIASSRILIHERFYILATAGLMTLLVGVSRVALGVHWATDVLGGWALGAGWALAWFLVASRFARH